jgi:hypothetical protein
MGKYILPGVLQEAAFDRARESEEAVPAREHPLIKKCG